MAALVSGCFSPEFGLAQCVACPDGVCPGDLSCVANRCVYPGLTVCDGAGKGGNLGTGGQAPVAGDDGAGEGGTSDLAISAIGAPDFLCTGRSSRVSLAVSGGAPPYRWSLVGGTSRFTLQVADAEARLEGTPSQAEDLELAVVVRDQGEHSVEWRWSAPVRETPSVRTSEIPSVCPNELYEVKLEADGGEPADRTWSVTDLPESTGLSLVGERIEGHFAGAPGATHLDFAVTAEASGCVSEPASLSLKIESPTAAKCPGIALQGDPVRPPPHPCLGGEYRAELIVQRGVPPYDWEATVEPKGLVFDPQQQTLSGVATEPGEFAVRVRDGGGRTVQVSYQLEPRDKCWFSYVSTGTTPARLELFDPVLEHRRSYPTQAEDTPVIDFRFSPDGRYLAYRRGLQGALRVAIVRLDTGQEQGFELPSVVQYDWSPNSKVLAVAFGQEGARSLLAIDVGQAATAAGGAEAGGLRFTQLTPTPAKVDSAFGWFSPGEVGFLSAIEGPLLLLSRSSLAPGGFEVPRTLIGDAYLPDTPMRSTPSGLYLIPIDKDIPIAFYGEDGSALVFHDEVIGGTGRWVGRARSGALEVFRAADGSWGRQAKPRAVHSGCDALLAWSERRERIACAQANAENQVVIFDLDEKKEALGEFAAVRGNYEYPPGAHVQRRRAFSPNGERFAFTTDDELHVATLVDGTPRTNFDTALPPAAVAPHNAFAELGFSPDGNLLLMHRGPRLSFFDVQGRTLEVVLSNELSPSIRCEEDPRDTGGGWCGAERPSAPFAWAPSSERAAFQTQDGTLEIYDFTMRENQDYRSVKVQGCSAVCQFGFQP